MSSEQAELAVTVLAGKLGALTMGVHHTITLSALLALYVGIARNNPCCAQETINALLDAADEISGTSTPAADVQSNLSKNVLVH